MFRKFNLAFKKHFFLLVSKNRSNAFLKVLNRFCRKFIRAYENGNNDHVSNGEAFLLNKLANNERWVIFDVGANIGKWTMLARKFFLVATIHSFEPIPSLYQRLLFNVAGMRAIVCNPFGLGNVNERIDFVQDLNNTLFSSSIKNEHHQFCQIIQCDIKTGDAYCLENNIERIHFLKIDVEGAEHMVLEGFHNMLSAGKIDIIQFEYSAINIETGYLLRQFFTVLEQYGYQIGKLYPKGVEFRTYTNQMEDFIGLNYVAVYNRNMDLLQRVGI